MPIVEPTKNHKYHLDGYLKSNLDHVYKEVTRKDFDSFLVVSGREGYGKSTLAGQIALYLDPTYNLNRCTFTAEQFEEACESAKKYQAVVFDETMGYLSSRGAMSKFNRRLVKIMSEMRSKNLFVLLCIPNFFELDKYPAIHRSTGLIEIYQRRAFKLFNYNSKKYYYLSGKKYYHSTQKPTFRGRFTRYFTLDKEEYEKKKQKSIKESIEVSAKEKRFKEQRDKLVRWAYKENWMNGVTQEKIAEVMGTSRRYIGYLLEN